MVDTQGRLVGINQSIVSGTGGNMGRQGTVVYWLLTMLNLLTLLPSLLLLL